MFIYAQAIRKPFEWRLKDRYLLHKIRKSPRTLGFSGQNLMLGPWAGPGAWSILIGPDLMTPLCAGANANMVIAPQIKMPVFYSTFLSAKGLLLTIGAAIVPSNAHCQGPPAGQVESWACNSYARQSFFSTWPMRCESLSQKSGMSFPTSTIARHVKGFNSPKLKLGP